MPKRFTETTKWTDRWYRTLSIKHKALWQYLCDRCDNAGVWSVDFELASFYIGATISEKDLEVLNKDKERVVMVNDRYLVIKEFISFQIGDTKQEKLTNLQKNCNSLIDTYLQKGIDIVKIMNTTSSLRVDNIKATDISKGKGIVKDKDNNKDIYKEFIKLTKEEHANLVNAYGQKATDDYIQCLNDYIGSTGKKYKSHYHTILTWARREPLKPHKRESEFKAQDPKKKFQTKAPKEFTDLGKTIATGIPTTRGVK